MIKIEFISNCNNKINEYIIFSVVPGARKHTVNNKCSCAKQKIHIFKSITI